MTLWVACYGSVSVTPSGALRPRAVMQCASASERDVVRTILRWMAAHRDELERDADLARRSEQAGPAARARLDTEVLTPARMKGTSALADLGAFIDAFRGRLDAIIEACGADAPGSALDLTVTRLEGVEPSGLPHRLALRSRK